MEYDLKTVKIDAPDNLDAGEAAYRLLYLMHDLSLTPSNVEGVVQALCPFARVICVCLHDDTLAFAVCFNVGDQFEYAVYGALGFLGNDNEAFYSIGENISFFAESGPQAILAAAIVAARDDHQYGSARAYALLSSDLEKITTKLFVDE